MAAFHKLTNEDAAHSIPVAFEATVAYHIKGSIGLFVQDGNSAIYADAPENAILTPGDRVLVRGKTHIGFRPEIVAESVTVIGHGSIPKPVAADYTGLVRGDFDCRRVSVHGVIRSADLVTYGKQVSIYIQVLMDGGYVDAIIDSGDGDLPRKLRGAEVEVAGSAGGKFDSKMQMTGVVLKVFTASDVKILKEGPGSAAARALTPMDEILQHAFIRDLSDPVRVEGTITYYLPGAAVVLQNGTRSLWIQTKDQQPLRIGDQATVLGYPAVGDGRLTLTSGEVEDSRHRSPMAPQRITWNELSSGASAFNLISIDGQVVKEDRKEYQDEYVVTAEGHLFSVIYRHTDEDLGFELPPMKQLPVGAKVRVTGVQSVSYGSNPFEGPAGFDILLRTYDDLELIARPSLLSVQNLIWLIGVLLAVIILIGIRVIWTERQARLRSAALADLERRRGKILEDINNSQPLREILEKIRDLVSLRLDDAPCWIRVDDVPLSDRAGSVSRPAGLRVVEEPILSRSGLALGAICAGFEPQKTPGTVEAGILAQAAELAKLAIETSQLYSDLIYRSEFDLLTGSHNRFSFEKQIEAAIQGAKRLNGSFGVLYIDLNDFKLVNDKFGHHAGDLYLQEVAFRMKGQLRPGDVLARQGGDEFAVILPNASSRAGVEEIMRRLERCFDQPFACDSCTVHGSASIGMSIYPADGSTRDSLLNAADAAMYVAKQGKRNKKMPLQLTTL